MGTASNSYTDAGFSRDEIAEARVVADDFCPRSYTTCWRTRFNATTD
ncbi:MAG: hypothetical protein ABEK59_07975 [Halobacteria archaeon]